MDKNRIDQLLVIRLSALGDVAMTVPVLNAFTTQNPDVKITVLTRPFFKPLFNDLQNVDVLGIDLKNRHKGFYGLWRLYSELKKKDFHAVADLHNVLRTNVLKSYFGLGSTPYFQIDKGRKEKKALTRQGNKDFKPLKSTFERYADVFRRIGFDLDLEKVSPQPRLPIPDNAASVLRRDSRKWIGIAPFAAFEGKMYPVDMMEEVIEKLNNTERYNILLFGGGPEETAALKEIASKNQNVINMAGTCSFQEELSFISNLDIMISMDSGNAHLAAMYGIPTVTIWGVTHPFAGFYPFGQDMDNALLADREQFPQIPTSVYGNKMPDGYHQAITTISPEQVVDKVETVLSG